MLVQLVVDFLKGLYFLNNSLSYIEYPKIVILGDYFFAIFSFVVITYFAVKFYFGNIISTIIFFVESDDFLTLV